MAVYCKGTPADRADILDFANYVFSQSHTPHDFNTLLPKLYSEKYDTTGYHYLAKEDGRIKAMVMLEPITLRVGQHTLALGGVGTVSVHPYARGSGYMKELMKWVTADIRKDYDLGVLGGQRQRYEYFGFEPCGVQQRFHVSKTNIRHRYSGVEIGELTLTPIVQTDTATLAAIHALQAAAPLSGVRSDEKFFDTLSSWHAAVWAVAESGRFAGYLCGSKHEISELYLSDYALLPRLLKLFFQEIAGDSCDFLTSACEQPLTAELLQLCEGFQLTGDHSFLLAKPIPVITALLELKATLSPLISGSIVVKIEDTAYRITLQNHQATVEMLPPDTAEGTALAMTELAALQLLFSHAASLPGALDALPAFARGWFPLPLYLPNPDAS